MIRIESLTKTYGIGNRQVRALDDVSFTIQKGEFIAIMGPSGSGKSTLLHLIGGVDKPTKGKVIIEDTGNLDSQNGHEVIEPLKLSNKKYGRTLVLITHDEKLVLQVDRILLLEDGKIIRDERTTAETI